MECGWKDLEVWYFGDEGGEKTYNKKGVLVLLLNSVHMYSVHCSVAIKMSDIL